MSRKAIRIWVAVLCLGAGWLFAQTAGGFSPALFQGMRWRLIGPFRGGRVVAVSGVPSQPGVFYFGGVDSGVWKSTDYGNTWHPIFDHEPTGSIGALAVAPSNPNIIYVGSGEGLRRPDLSVGDGVYRSSDAGRTWVHLGLRHGQQIGAIAVDPTNPNRLFVAVLGHPYGPNPERGVYRSTDGGQTFQRVLYKNAGTGSPQVVLDPANPQIVYADLWASRYVPWALYEGSGDGLYKSTDGGATWHRLTAGLPSWSSGRLGRIGIGIAPSNPNRIYAWVEARKGGGIYISNDAGASWRMVNDERRIIGRAFDFADVTVDPKNENRIYVANTSSYVSTDAGRHFVPFKGAPGGDDYHTIWIDPANRNVMIFGVDQGTTITVNRGATWSSWYNQPTGQMYKVATDNAFPYRVYSGQQDSGSVGISSRGDYGAILHSDWAPVGAMEYADVAPDPIDSNLVFGAGAGGVTRFSWRTRQTQAISPVPPPGAPPYRYRRTSPIVFSMADPHALYLGAQMVLKTVDGGRHWQAVSPDLSRPHPVSVPTLGRFGPENDAKPARGVVYAIGPSPLRAGVIWAGTDDGLIWVTRDGGAHWTNVTPPQLKPWWKVSTLDAGHFSPGACYAAINTMRLDEMVPHLFRTHDYGRHWTEIDTGLPLTAATDVVREDPKRAGLLYAGTETSVYVSFDDGDHWQSLQLNLPHTSMRDLTIHRNDLVVGTHGRAFWILDDLTPLRQLTPQVAAAPAYLFKPEAAYRIRRNVNTDTPLIPETPQGKNPPDGAILDYVLHRAPTGPVTLAIYDSVGNLVRRYSSQDRPPATRAQLEQTLTVPFYWVKPFQPLSAAAGMHRFVWDLHYPPPDALRRSYPISAIAHDTPLYPRGAIVPPGSYTVKLTVDGQTFSQPLTVRMDPRSRMTAVQLEEQFRLARAVDAAIDRTAAAARRTPALARQLDRLNAALAALVGGSTEVPGFDAVDEPVTAAQRATWQRLQAELNRLLH